MNYALFNSVFKKFAVNADVTKSAPLGPAAKKLLGSNSTNSGKKGVIIVREQHTARIYRGTALHDHLRLENVNYIKRGYCSSKKLKGNDVTVVYELTAT